VCGYNDGAPYGGSVLEVLNRAGVILQLESKIGCEAADEIAAVEGGK
jgi:hypothetical protein